jgi:hypothetical protein
MVRFAFDGSKSVRRMLRDTEPSPGTSRHVLEVGTRFHRRIKTALELVALRQVHEFRRRAVPTRLYSRDLDRKLRLVTVMGIKEQRTFPIAVL